MSERPVDIWNKMVRGARVTGRCMFCESEIFPSYKNKRPVICIDDGCRKTYHRIPRSQPQGAASAEGSARTTSPLS